MTHSADWERVKQLFHEALDVAPDARLAFVQERAGDAQVLQEVMSLLQAYPAAEGFLSTPPTPRRCGRFSRASTAGDELGPFRITGLIGAGGMGEVYRAWDTRLDRQVAIKVLQQALIDRWCRARAVRGGGPGDLPADPSAHQHAVRRRLGVQSAAQPCNTW